MSLAKAPTVFVSGGSRGIGLAVALRLARAGANVTIAAKTCVVSPPHTRARVFSGSSSFIAAQRLILSYLVRFTRQWKRLRRLVGRGYRLSWTLGMKIR